MARRKLETLLLMTAILALNVLGTLASVAQANFSPLPPAPKQVYIRADGSVDPPDAPFAKNGNVYSMIKNLTYCAIVIERANTVLYGGGYMLWNEYANGYGINVTNLANVTVQNLNVEGFQEGIHGENVTYFGAIGNIITRCSFGGIFIHVSRGSRVQGNLLTDNNVGIQLNNSTGATVSQNIVEASASPGWGKTGFKLTHSTNNLFTENGMVNISMTCFELLNSSGNRIYGNNLSGGLMDWYVDPNVKSVYTDIQPSVNVWDNGTAGNYWGPYYGTDENQNGISDQPCTLGPYNVDRFPLANPVFIPVPTLSLIEPQPTPTSTTLSSFPTLAPTPAATTSTSPTPTPSTTSQTSPTREPKPTPEPQPPSSDFLPLGGIVTALAAVVAIIASVASLHKKGLC